MAWVRHFMIRNVLPRVWKASPERRIRSLQEFALTELDSGWQSLTAIPHSPTPRIKSLLFRHALEEIGHNQLFLSLVEKESNSLRKEPVMQRNPLLDGSYESLVDYMAYTHAGESEINKDFPVYAESDVPDHVREAFRQLKAEEEGHEDFTATALLELLRNDEKHFHWIVRTKKWKRSWQQFNSIMERFGELPMKIILVIVYFVAGLFVWLPMSRRMRLSASDQLEILQQQNAAAKLSCRRAMERT